MVIRRNASHGEVCDFKDTFLSRKSQDRGDPFLSSADKALNQVRRLLRDNLVATIQTHHWGGGGGEKNRQKSVREHYELPRREREIGNKAPGRFSVVRSEGLRPNFAQLISIFPSGELTSTLNFQGGGDEKECNF